MICISWEKSLYPDQYHGSRPLYSEPWNPLATENVHTGTLLGVYEVLEDFLGVRWLWPGDLGTYVPRRSTFVVPKSIRRSSRGCSIAILVVGTCRKSWLTGSYIGRKVPRNYRVGGMSEEIVGKLVFPTAEAAYTYGRAMEVYHRRHRRVTQIEERACSPCLAFDRGHFGHVGEVRQRASGMVCHASRRRTRTQRPRAGAWTPLCVSNSELHHFIVEQAWDGGDELRLGEADAAGESMCHCPQCLAWDGPQPKEIPGGFAFV